MKKTLIASLVALLPITSQADTLLGVYAGGQYWDMEATGAFGDNPAIEPFNLADDKKQSFWLAVEHFIPLVPNIKLRHNQLDTHGLGLHTEFSFGDKTFSNDMNLDAELDHTDIILYYEIFDNDLISLDVGANLKYGDYKITVTGDVSVDGQPALSASSTEEYSGVIPTLYLMGEIGIPSTDITLYGDISYLSFDGDTAYDVQGGLKYRLIDNMAVDMDIQLGYRKILIDVEDLSGLYIDAEFDGYFGGVEFHF
jgi:outer membrane protein